MKLFIHFNVIIVKLINLCFMQFQIQAKNVVNKDIISVMDHVLY